MSISLVINTRNEASNLPRCIKSVGDLASEIIVVDMESSDNTVEIAKQLGAQVFTHQQMGYVEPARNFAISKAAGPWILLLDADEELSPTLHQQLKNISQSTQIDYLEIPRQNLIFNQWVQHSGWWPDYNIRFFKKDSVAWTDQIHSRPQTVGVGQQLPDFPENAIIHHHYQTISQYLERLNRYTEHQLAILRHQKYQFTWPDLLIKPANEFFRRYFAEQGFKDGVHGLALALLQSFSELILYLKAWEAAGFTSQTISPKEFAAHSTPLIKDFFWWLGRKPFASINAIKASAFKIISKMI